MFIFFVSSLSSSVHASTNQSPDTKVVFEIGDNGIEMQNEGDGNYVGTIVVSGNSKSFTSVTAHLSGHTGGIPNLYQLILSWVGTSPISMMVAESIKVTDTSILFPVTYYETNIGRQVPSSNIGTVTLGAFTIPLEVKKVRVKSSGLQVFFNDSGWAMLGSQLNGALDINR